MGTRADSHYVTGRKDYTCISCGVAIPPGTRHLVFLTGIITRRRICYACSVRLGRDNEPVYDCRDVRERLAREAHAAELRALYPQPPKD